MATDAFGKLYVVDAQYPRVEVFAPPYNGEPEVLNDPDTSTPVDVAVDSAGNVAITNGEFGSVSFYSRGATNPTRVVSSRLWGTTEFCAFDTHGNLFLDGYRPFGQGQTFKNTLVGEISVGTNTISTLQTSNTIVYPGGIQVTKQGRVAILDGTKIYTYNAPVRGWLGSPVSTTQLLDMEGYGVQGFAFGTSDNDVYAPGFVNNAPTLNEYPFPQGGLPIQSWTFHIDSSPWGVAVAPAEQF